MKAELLIFVSGAFVMTAQLFTMLASGVRSGKNVK